MSIPLPTGRQFTIRHGDDHATIVELGGGLRSCVLGGRELLDGFASDEAISNSRGQVLAPWPNRIDGGSYEWDGATHQLALSEPARGNAIHGLLRFVRWECVRHDDDRVVVSQLVLPQPGYPFTLAVEVSYQLGAGGLEVTTTARNVGDVDLPWACGQHPYLAMPDGASMDACTVHLDAVTYIATDARGIPTERLAADGSPCDLRAGRALNGLSLDTAFTDLARDADGVATVDLLGPEGSGTRLWVDASYPYIQLFSGDTLPGERRRRGLAVEPMTAPANAFVSGEDVIRLEPGRRVTHRWGMQVLLAGEGA